MRTVPQGAVLICPKNWNDLTLCRLNISHNLFAVFIFRLIQIATIPAEAGTLHCRLNNFKQEMNNIQTDLSFLMYTSKSY